MIRKLAVVLMLLLSCMPSDTFGQNNLLPTLQKYRAEYPTPPSPAQVGELLNRVAWEHRAQGWGLLRKDTGSRCPHDSGVSISCDILIHAPSITHFDVLRAQETEAVPQWTNVGPCVPGPTSGCSMTMFLQPTQPRDGQPPIHPPEPPVDLTPLLRRLTLLEAQGRDFSRRITELEATDEFLPLALEVQRLAEAVKVLQNGLAALVDTKTPPPTRCVVTIFGTRINCRLE